MMPARATLAALLASLCGCAAITGSSADYDAWTGPYVLSLDLSPAGASCHYEMGLILSVGHGNHAGMVTGSARTCEGQGIEYATGGPEFEPRLKGSVETPRITFTLASCRFSGTGSGSTDNHRWSGEFVCEAGSGYPAGSGSWVALEDNRFSGLPTGPFVPPGSTDVRPMNPVGR